MELRCVATRGADPLGAGAFLIYLAVSVLTLGRSLIAQPAARYIGNGVDPSQFMWYLRWWPYAIAHGLNPFLPRIIWPPGGVNIAWAASIPLPSILAYPLTATIGIVPTFNLLCLICPALAGWAAFLVCRLVSRSYWPSLLGGFIFGFSAHMLGKSFGNLNDAIVFPVPLALYLAILWYVERIATRTFVLLLSALLIIQFLCFIETFATMSLFGGLALMLALGLYEGDERKRLVAMIAPLAMSYAFAIIVISPYIYFLFAHRMRSAEIMPAYAYSIDPVNFLIPSPLNELGRISMFVHLSSFYVGGLMESGGYLGPALIVIAVLFARRYWREKRGRLMVDLLILMLVFAMGPRLHVLDDITQVALPWAPFVALPFIQKALPARFMLYATLDLAIMAALWLSTLDARPIAKVTIAAFTVFLSLPNLSANYWTVETGIPQFFLAGLYRRYLTPGENVIIIPYGVNGDAMLWQATANMYFKMVQGWTGFPEAPAEFENWPIMDALLRNVEIPDFGIQLKAFLAAYHISTVIVVQGGMCTWQYLPTRFAPRTWSRAPISEHDSMLWTRWLATLGVTPIRVGGVMLYRTPAQILASHDHPDVIALKASEEMQRFPVILKAAARYLDEGRDLNDLSPMHAMELHLLPPDWISQDVLYPNPESAPLLSNLLVGSADNGKIAVGVVAPYQALVPVLAKYGASASAVTYLSMDTPHVVVKDPAATSEPLLMIVTFDRKSLLAEAANIDARQPGTATGAPAALEDAVRR
ncbi:MAG: hypothetical protein IVW56_11890 [Candidatus Binataceae bacterium]|nr:hypothetical protein [Candidatus Binataceae bacterium]